MPPLIRNLIIRLVAWFGQVLRAFVGGLRGISAVLGRSLGLSASGYYVEGEADARAAQPTLQQADSPQLTPSSEATAAKSVPPPRSLRRSSQTEMDYFRNMARQIKNSGS